MVKVRIMCYSLIHAKLRLFLRKLADDPGWIRFPSPAPSMIQPMRAIAAVLMLFSFTARAQTNAWAGSLSCRECHSKFYKLWSTSFHGLAMQMYTPELSKTLPAQKSEIV